MKSPRMLSILAIAIAAMAAPSLMGAPPVFQLVGTSEIGAQFTACILNTGNGELMQLDSTADATATDWRVTETIRNRNGDVIRLLIQKGPESYWLGLTGAPEIAPAPIAPQPMPSLDLPEGSLNRLHNQRTYRARIKPHPVARKALRETSDLDPLPKLSRQIKR